MPDDEQKFNPRDIRGVNDPRLQELENRFSEDAPIPPDVAITPPAQPEPRSNKKKIIAIVAVVLILLGVGGSAAAYVLYTSPEKVVFDAVQNSIKAKTYVTEGTYVVRDSESKSRISVDFTSQSNSPEFAGSIDTRAKLAVDGFNVTLDAAAMVSEKGDYYFKLSNAKELLDKALESEFGKFYTDEPAIQPLITKIQAFVKKIDGRWIKVEKSDITQYSDEYEKQQECAEKAVKAFYENDKQQQQVIDAYGDNKFIIIKNSNKPSRVINGQDSVAYDISLDVKKGNSFREALDKTEFFTSLTKCIDDKANLTEKATDSELKEAQKEADKLKLSVWVSRWSHQFTRIEIGMNEDSTSMEFGATLDQNKKPNLKDPTDALEVKDISGDLEEIYQEMNSLDGSLESSETVQSTELDPIQEL